MASATTSFTFARFPILQKQVFMESPNSFAFVNLKPIIPVHVLCAPKRVCSRFEDLTYREISDLMRLSKCVGQAVKQVYEAKSMTLSIQDGPEAGQTVPHVHVHVIPRKLSDFGGRNDEIYERLDEQCESERIARVDAEEGRRARTMDEMAEEAEVIRAAILRLGLFVD